MKIISKNRIVYGFALIIFLALGYFLFFSAPRGFEPNTIINIEQSKSLRGLSAMLKNENIIRSRVAFEAFIILHEGEKHIVPGNYLLENKMPVFEVARRISKGDHHLPPVKVTIPEGFNNSEISQAFSFKLTNFNQTNFLKETSDRQGYLFPDTYFLLTTNNEDDVIRLMSENYEKKIIPSRPEIAQSGKTEKEIITMASIIEGEAKGNNDRGIISGILWKRISLGMPLQVDVAPSTYKTKGLPDNPISNPGLESIKAAIHPTDSPYLYYLHDSAGIVHFARTFEEHKANKAKYLK